MLVLPCGGGKSASLRFTQDLGHRRASRRLRCPARRLAKPVRPGARRALAAAVVRLATSALAPPTDIYSTSAFGAASGQSGHGESNGAYGAAWLQHAGRRLAV